MEYLSNTEDKQYTVKSKRFKEIDALRGLAVLLMVFSHGLRWVYESNPVKILGIFGHTPGDIATPMFYLAAGLALYFSCESRLNRNTDPQELRKEYSIRLGKLFLIGVFMSLSWGVLQAQAVSLFILVWFVLSAVRKHDLNFLRSLFPSIMLLALLLHLLLSQSQLSLFWGKILAGQFPLFAILLVNAVGFYFAPYLRSRFFSWGCLGLGIGLVVIALLLNENGISIVRYGASIPFLLLGMGLSFFLLGIFNFGFFQKSLLFRYFTLIGQDALFIFVFHYVIFFLPFYFMGLLGNMTSAGALMFAGIVVTGAITAAILRRNSSLSVYNIFDTIFLASWHNLLLPIGKWMHTLSQNLTYPGEAGARLDK